MIQFLTKNKHEAYDDDNLLNDIALLILDRDVTLNEKIQLACLPQSLSKTYPGNNVDGWIAGWGFNLFSWIKDF
jgi:hypothetical protein